MKDQKDTTPKTEGKTYLERLETATPAQASQSIIAKILQKLQQLKESQT